MLAGVSKHKSGEHVEEVNLEYERTDACGVSRFAPDRVRQDDANNHQCREICTETRHFLAVQLLHPADGGDEADHHKLPELRRAHKLVADGADKAPDLGHEVAHDDEVADHVPDDVDAHTDVDDDNSLWIETFCAL